MSTTVLPLVITKFLKEEPVFLEHYLNQASSEEQKSMLFCLKQPAHKKALIDSISLEHLEHLILLENNRLNILLVENLDTDRLTLLLNRLPETYKRDMIKLIPVDKKKSIEEAFAYPENTAGSLMRHSIPVLESTHTVSDAIKVIRTKKYQYFQHLVIIHADNFFVGLLLTSDLMKAAPHTLLTQHIEEKFPPVYAMSAKSDLISIITKYYLPILPVVDHENKYLGYIKTDLLMRTIQEEALADIQTMVGASPEEKALSSAFFAVKKRVLWLNINLLTAFLAASVVALFQDTIAKFTALAVLLPVVAGQAGNTGAQAQAVVMRGLALKEFSINQWLKVSFKETLAGLCNGVIIGIVTGLGVYYWSKSMGLTLIMVASMILALVISSVSGALVPIILKALNQDPAQSSSIILTTITDCVGFTLFLGLATIFAKMLA